MEWWHTFVSWFLEWWAVSQPWLALGTAMLFFITGLAGCLLPIIPGPLIVWVGMLIHKIWVPEDSVSWWIIFISAIFVGFTFLLDYLLTLAGAKKFGASRAGAIGALLGGFIGLLIPPFIVWVIIGPFIGALAGELITGNNLQKASRVGWGSFLGTLAGFAAKTTICFLIIGFFMINVLFIAFS